MRTRTALISLLSAAAVLGAAGGTPAQAATRPSVAYFEVELHATQAAGWKEQLFSHACGGTSETDGAGDSSVRLQSVAPVVVTARRVAGPERVQLLLGRPYGVPISGNVVRQGNMTGTHTGQVSGDCGRPIPTPIDCGSRSYPRGSGITLEYDTPTSWDEMMDGPTPPLVPVLHIRGPVWPQPPAWVPYLNCPGERDDALLGVPRPDGGMNAGSAPLSIQTLFGRRRHFTVHDSFQRSVALPIPAPLTGSHNVTVALGWTVKFTRLAHRPAGAPR